MASSNALLKRGSIYSTGGHLHGCMSSLLSANQGQFRRCSEDRKELQSKPASFTVRGNDHLQKI